MDRRNINVYRYKLYTKRHGTGIHQRLRSTNPNYHSNPTANRDTQPYTHSDSNNFSNTSANPNSVSNAITNSGRNDYAATNR